MSHMSILANKHTMEDGREYIVIEMYNDKGEVEEKLINIEEAADLINEISAMYEIALADLDDAECEVELWKNMYRGYYSNTN